jgi:hypothetical protein
VRGTLPNLHCDPLTLDDHFAFDHLLASAVLHSSLRPSLSFLHLCTYVKYELILTVVFPISESSAHVRRTKIVLAHLLNCCTPNLV